MPQSLIKPPLLHAVYVPVCVSVSEAASACLFRSVPGVEHAPGKKQTTAPAVAAAGLTSAQCGGLRNNEGVERWWRGKHAAVVSRSINALEVLGVRRVNFYSKPVLQNVRSQLNQRLVVVVVVVVVVVEVVVVVVVVVVVIVVIVVAVAVGGGAIILILLLP
ncbi:hypothetical protein ElyMa_001967000 [Elysia marginata]|uniref:Uncharacterized protein n=1 Tax=Elysia marginata TaxID=1093978 RepID=A0AAV4F051_9GAST|nr:hypothetical protein ElyMa_001967000 [Elysia marginata]